MAEPRVIEIYGLCSVYKADIISFRSLVYFFDDTLAEYLVADLVAHLVDLGVGLVEFSCDHHIFRFYPVGNNAYLFKQAFVYVE